ncbi:MAG: hypothetical protein ACYC44_00125 [Patescibacteria group bacterium]
MTREDFARSTVWIVSLWLASALNAVSLWPQALNVIRSKTAEDIKTVSLTTFVMILYIQIVFCFFGWINQNIVYTLSVAASASANITTIIWVLYLRYFRRKT